MYFVVFFVILFVEIVPGLLAGVFLSWFLTLTLPLSEPPVLRTLRRAVGGTPLGPSPGSRGSCHEPAQGKAGPAVPGVTVPSRLVDAFWQGPGPGPGSAVLGPAAVCLLELRVPLVFSNAASLQVEWWPVCERVPACAASLCELLALTVGAGCRPWLLCPNGLVAERQYNPPSSSSSMSASRVWACLCTALPCRFVPVVSNFSVHSL